jgi:hypothetical protein
MAIAALAVQTCKEHPYKSWIKVPRQNVRRQNVRRHNVRGQNVWRDKHPGEQHIRRVKMSGRTKYPADKMSDGQNIWWDKTSSNITSGGQNVRRDKTPGDKTSVWVIFKRAMLGNICWLTSLLSLEEKFAETMHFFCVPARGWGKHTYLTEVLYIF